MKNSVQLLVVFIMLTFSSKAQYTYFPAEGTITYDKTVHVKNLLRRHISSLKEGDFQRNFMEELMGQAPDTYVLHKKLVFADTQYSYEHIKDDYPELIKNLMDWGVLDYQINSFTDLKSQTVTSFFDLAGTSILLQDSLVDVKWKITDEYRNIAGYDCRRANGVTLDSIFVVAFYTDQIPITAGPGGIHGLPGAILGFVVPELHYNIYATDIKVSPAPVRRELGQKKKDKPMNRRDFYKQLQSSMGQFIGEKQYNLIMANIFI